MRTFGFSKMRYVSAVVKITAQWNKWRRKSRGEIGKFYCV